MLDLVTQYIPTLAQIAMALAILVVGWLASKWVSTLVRSACRNAKTDEALGGFIGSLAKYAVLAAAVISSLGTVGVQTTSLVAVFASAGLAVGLALQGNLANLASGVMILVFRPLRIGDKVTVAGNTAFVTEIGIFATTLQTASNEIIYVPNSMITGGVITNFSQVGILRSQVKVSLAGDTDYHRAADAIIKAATRASLVLSDPAPTVAFTGMGGGAIELTVYAFSKSDEQVDMNHNLRVAIYEDLKKEGIMGSVPQMVIHKAE